MLSQRLAYPAYSIAGRKAPRGAQQKKDLAACAKRNKVGKKIPGAVLLSHSQLYSTIAAGVLNHRVREGNGCFNSAMSTGKNHNEEKCLSANPTRFRDFGANVLLETVWTFFLSLRGADLRKKVVKPHGRLVMVS